MDNMDYWCMKEIKTLLMYALFLMFKENKKDKIDGARL